MTLASPIAAVCSTSVELQSEQASNFTPRQAQTLIEDYCVTCHNQTANTGGLALDSQEILDVGRDAETWEAVVRKLRTGMMPPRGAARPPRSELDRFATWLEEGLDRAAVANPNPGAPTLHRLNRSEYQNAIRDLLDLEVDATILLPADSAASGFDNIADVLNTSPALIQGYLSAAMKISRLAVGDLTAPPTITTYQSQQGLSQSEHIEGLPLGTQGGMIVRHTFPLDAEYEFSAGGDFTIDGERVVSTGGGGRGGRGGRGALRVRVPAGPHTLAVSSLRTMDSTGVDDTFSAPARGGRGSSVTITGPFDPTGPGDTPSRRRIFVCRPPEDASAAEETGCANRILSRLATLAFRRPVSPDDAGLTRLITFYQTGRDDGSFETGIQQALARLLVDPEFIFRMEQAPPDLAVGEVHRLTDLEIASRLSFFLWSSIPDEELLTVADRGVLSDPSVLAEQARRMLADSRSQALIDNFAAQWLQLRDLENAEPESGDFDGNLRLAFERETTMLFESIVREDRSILDLLDADYTFVDERLARHYEIPNIRGSRVRRVSLEADSPRRGILGHGSVLLVTSAANRTSPVTRGKWVLENLLGTPPPSPPPGVETNLDEAAGTTEPASLRERMEIHRSNPVCSSCHSIMDPIGFTLENFDLVGKWRELDGDSMIDASAVLVDGTRLDGPASLRKALLERSDAFVTTAVEKLMTYAIGRPTEYFDMPAVRSVLRESKTTGYNFSALVLGIVGSEPFRMRMKESGTATPEENNL